MRNNWVIALAALAIMVVLAVSGCSSSQENSGATATPSATPVATPVATPSPVPAYSSGNDEKALLGDIPGYSITVTGGNVSPVTLTYADLKAMDFVDTGNASMMAMSGPGVEMTADFAGVPVDAILARAGVPSDNVTFHITAPDGYDMDYSRAQLAGSIIGLVQDGVPAVADVNNKTAIVLVVPGQRGPMWIKVPTGIEMVKG